MPDKPTPPYRSSPSPAPTRPPEAKVYASQSGNWSAVVGDVRRSSVWNALITVGMIAAALAWAQSRLDGGVQSGVRPLEARIEAEERARKEAIKELKEEMKDGFRAVREDFRARERGEPLPPLPPSDGGL